MRELFNPDLYHGAHKNKNYFEGWYYKLVDRYNNNKLAIIPGISYGNSNDEHHAFIQVLNGHDVIYDYIEFDSQDFKFNNNKFKISIKSNIFTLNNIDLNLEYNNKRINGHLIFKNTVKWPSNVFSPGSMGFYNYLKFMECYSQVCIVNGSILGCLNIDNKNIDFTGGKVYIEKNWGKSFPKSWLWIQSNNFKDRSVSVTCSLGEVPIPGKIFQGFLIGVTVNNKFISFTTINRSKLTLKSLGDDVTLTVQNKNLRLTLKTFTNKNNFVLCKGPKNGTMSPAVKETLNGQVYMLLEDIKSNKKIYEDIGLSTGVEYGGTLMKDFSYSAKQKKL